MFCPNCGASVGKPAADGAPRAPAQTRTFSGLETIVDGGGRAKGAPTLEQGAIFAGRYAIERKVGEGGMGVVYLARDNNTAEEVVLKLIHPTLVSGDEAMKRLVAEGVTARQIRHPNIVAVYDVGQSDGQPFLTMEYVKGGTLRTWLVNAIASGQETGLNTAIGLVRSILAGLGEAHRMGFVHRDLKPENILLNGDPAQGDFALKILDFGIAKAVSSSTANRISASTGGVGTPLYMAPEQKTAPDTVGPPADLYSVSAILYEILMEAAPQGRWEFPSEHRADVPKALDKVLERGLAMRARTRFQTVAEYLSALDDAVGGARQAVEPDANVKPEAAEPEKRQPIAPDPTNDAAKRKRYLLWGGAVAGILVIAAIANQLDKPEPQKETIIPAQPSTLNVAGVWYDDSGAPFQATQNGNRISATGMVQGAPVRLEGSSSGSNLKFQVANSMTGQQMYVGDAFLLNPSHLSYSLYAPNGGLINRGCFHLNHLPNPPCVNGRL